MDDIVVFTPTHWILRRAVRLVNQVLAALGLAKHPAKTFIGRIAKGFGFVGYQYGPDGLRVAGPTAARVAARVTRLSEYGADTVRIGAYVRHWGRWVMAGVGGMVATDTLAAHVQAILVRMLGPGTDDYRSAPGYAVQGRPTSNVWLASAGPGKN